METTNQTDSEVKPVEISSEERTLERLHSIIPQKKIRNKLYLSLLIFFCLVIVTSIFLIGYFCFNWFQKEPNTIVNIEKEQYQMDYFKESKKITSLINEKSKFEGSTQIQNIDIDFFVIINLKTRLTYFGTKDNLYNATLVILRTNISNEYTNLVTGQFNINDEKEINEMLKNPNITENPFATFSFYENGTLLGIYLPSEITEFTASLIIDLIEKVTPRISKEYYEKKEINKVSFKLKNNTNTSNETTLLEIHQLKEFKDKYTEVSFNGSSSHSNIERKVNEENKLEYIKSNSELVLNSQKNDNEENYVDLGFNDYHFHIDSDIKLISQKKQIETVNLINKIYEKVEFMESTDLMKMFGKTEKEKEEEEENKNDWEEENNSLLNENKLRNLNYFSSPYASNIPLLTTNILGKKLTLIYGSIINSNKAIVQLLFSCDSKIKKLTESTLSLEKDGNRKKNSWEKSIPIIELKYYFIVSFSFQINLEGFIEYSMQLRSNALIISFGTGLNIESNVGIGSRKILRIEAGIKGNLITFSLTHSITSKNSYESIISSNLSGGKISLFARIVMFRRVRGELSTTIFGGWSNKINQRYIN